MVVKRFVVLPLAILICALLCSPLMAQDGSPPDAIGYPRQQPFFLEISDMLGVIGPGSIVRVREFDREGTGLHFGALGMNLSNMYNLDFNAWINELNGVHFHFRYFDLGGDGFSKRPVLFNGTVIAGGQTLRSRPAPWLSMGLYYERRLTPLYRPWEQNWAEAFRGWDTAAAIGLEYTYINFEIPGAAIAAVSRGHETKEDFYHQEVPMPTVMLDLTRKAGEDFTFEASAKLNWINRWNSLRNEGGTVWASQDGEEFHLKLYYANRQWFGPIEPMLGFFAYRYTQLEDSHEDGNFIRWSSFGPEFGLACEF
jgi:hypothetical protein